RTAAAARSSGRRTAAACVGAAVVVVAASGDAECQRCARGYCNETYPHREVLRLMRLGRRHPIQAGVTKATTKRFPQLAGNTASAQGPFEAQAAVSHLEATDRRRRRVAAVV